MSHIESYRRKEERLVAGIMSGTSLDGIDVAFVEIAGYGRQLRFRLRSFSSIPYAEDMRQLLLRASSGEMTLREAFELDADLGAMYGAAVLIAAREGDIAFQQIDAIGLHGQTVYHAPRRQPNGVTVQLGSAAYVAERTRAIVVNDFRAADVAAGGEGAPLVPYCDYLLLHSPSRNRIALNIGGIANITWLPHDAVADTLVAFDTGPGNMLIDAAMRRLCNVQFDAEGQFAASGTPNDTWLQELLSHPYYQLVPPKSAGRENFGEEEGIRLVETALAQGMDGADIVATLTLLTARSIADAIVKFAAKGEMVHDIIVGGGGVRNRTLMSMLDAEMPGTTLVRSSDVGVDSDAKEAIGFAILANETLCEVPSNVPSVTGASRHVISGCITLP